MTNTNDAKALAERRIDELLAEWSEAAGVEFEPTLRAPWVREDDLRQLLRAALASAEPAQGEVVEAVDAYLSAQDDLDNREFRGPNAKPYDVLVRRRNNARSELDAALSAAPEVPRLAALASAEPAQGAVKALARIADMDPKCQRSDDLGRAARIAREAFCALSAAPAPVPQPRPSAALDDLIARLRTYVQQHQRLGNDIITHDIADAADTLDAMRAVGIQQEQQIMRLEAAPVPAVPQGWRIVPVEPTESMLLAAELSNPRGYRDLYAVMLAASPPVSTPAAQPVEPVAWRYQDAHGNYRYRGFKAGFDTEYARLKPIPLYATPPAGAADEALQWLERNLFERKWSGTLGEPSTWHVRGDYRHTMQRLRGETLQQAINAAREGASK